MSQATLRGFRCHVTTKVAEAHRAHLWTGVRVASYCRRPPRRVSEHQHLLPCDIPSHNLYGYYLFSYTFVSSESESAQPQAGRRAIKPPTPWPSSHQSRDSSCPYMCVLIHELGSDAITPSLCGVYPIIIPFGLADLVDYC